MRKFEHPKCYREGKGVYPLCIGNGSSLCKRCQLWEKYPDSPEEPISTHNSMRVDKIAPCMEVAFLRRQKNLYVPSVMKKRPGAYQMVEDFDTGERVFIAVSSDGEVVTDVKTDDEMDRQNNRPHLFGDTVTL